MHVSHCYTCTSMSFRVEKERNSLRAELDDVQSQCEHLQKGKVTAMTNIQLSEL